MRPAWNTLKNATKRAGLVELSRFFVFGWGENGREYENQSARTFTLAHFSVFL